MDDGSGTCARERQMTVAQENPMCVGGLPHHLLPKVQVFVGWSSHLQVTDRGTQPYWHLLICQ